MHLSLKTRLAWLWSARSTTAARGARLAVDPHPLSSAYIPSCPHKHTQRGHHQTSSLSMLRRDAAATSRTSQMFSATFPPFFLHVERGRVLLACLCVCLHPFAVRSHLIRIPAFTTRPLLSWHVPQPGKDTTFAHPEQHQQKQQQRGPRHTHKPGYWCAQGDVKGVVLGRRLANGV